jgi:hypothetical protein
MNPIASSFVPTVLSHAPTHDTSDAFSTSIGLEELSVSTQTMFRALATEQDAHRQTQTALDEVRANLAASEAANAKMKKQIKSLVSAVNMLGSIVKHNQTRLQPVEPTTPRKANIKPAKEPSPIVYDVLAGQKAKYEGRADTSTSVPQSDSGIDSEPVVKTRSRAGTADPFNLDLLQSPSSSDSNAAALNRTLRKHFLPTDSNNSDTLSASVDQREKLSLLHLTPEQFSKVQNALAAAKEGSPTPTRQSELPENQDNLNRSGLRSQDEVKVSKSLSFDFS